MAFEIGIAEGYLDVLGRLKSLLSNASRTIEDDENILELSPIPAGQTYTVLDWNTNWDGAGGCQLYLMGPGIAGDDEIFTGIQTYCHPGQDYYNWQLQGYTGYSGAATFHTQPGAIFRDVNNNNPKVLLWNQKIKYWFVANGNRYIGFLKVATVYEAFWGGFPLLYGFPVSIPAMNRYYPLIVGGSSCGYETSYPRRFSSTREGHRAFWDGYYAAGRASFRFLWDGTWLNGGNWTANTETGYSLAGVNIWPYLHTDYHSSPSAMPHKLFIELKANIDGSRPLFPLIACGLTPKNIYAELQGLYAVPGFGSLSAEDIITTPDDVRHIVFPNAFRTNFNNYVALKLE